MVDPSTVGAELEVCTFNVRQKKITKFAKAVGDAKPEYVDENIEGGTVAPPSYSSSYFIEMHGKGMMASKLSGPELGKLLHAAQEYRYFKPIRPEDMLTMKGKVADTYEKRGKDYVIYEVYAENQNGEKVAEVTITFAIRR